ncbi:unnamed protein product, partial [Symbiodinium pilosum]
TRAQLIQMHNGDYTAVDQLISRKRAAGHFREHPDFPGNPDYVLYYVTIDLSHSHIEESEDRMQIQLSGGASSSSDAARALGAGADTLFAGSSMQPGVPAVMPESSAGKGAGKGGKGKGG